MTRIKVCGITDIDDARDAALLGADAIGLNFHEASPRVVAPGRAMRIIDSLPPFVTSVGVFVDYPDPEALEDFATSMRLDAVQLHGGESPDYCSVIRRVKVIKAFRVNETFKVDSLRQYAVSGFLLDAYSKDSYGGTGRTFQWSMASGANAFGKVVLAGGLTPDNVGDAISELHPFAVDVSSGVESSPGRKDYELIRRFVESVHEADGK